MALTILNNVAALNAENNLGRSHQALDTSLERLSSGLKINRGADGPAALVISEEQRAQITGLQTAIDNTSKGINVVQTAEGALNEINALLNQIRGLALDSANSAVNDNNALTANQQQVINALATINAIAKNTTFGQKALIDGSAGNQATTASAAFSTVSATSSTAVGTYTVLVNNGADAATQAAQKGDVSIGADAVNHVVDSTHNLGQAETLSITGLSGSPVLVQLTSGMTNTAVAQAINDVTSQTGVVASLQSGNGRLELTAQNFGQNFTVQSNVAITAGSTTGVGTTAVVTSAAAPAGSDGVTTGGQNVIAKITNGATSSYVTGNGNTISIQAGPSTGLTLTFATSGTNPLATANTAAGGDLVTVANNSLTFQIGANAGQTASITVDSAQTTALGVGVSGVSAASLAQINIATTQGAQDAIKVVDQAIGQVTTLRGKLGAFQANTLQATSENLKTTLENTTATEATIRDTDFAKETADFTRNQVLLQAGATVLNNANQSSQLVLALLNGR